MGFNTGILGATVRLFNIVATLWIMAGLGKPLLAAQPGFSLDLAQTKNSVEFLAVGKPSAIKIRGALKEVEGGKPVKGTLLLSQTALSGRVEVQLASFDTGIELRTDHMLNKYLEVKKFPIAELTNLKAELPAQVKEESYSVEKVAFAAELSLHGVKKSIAGLVAVKKHKSDSTPQLIFSFEIDTKEFAIETPSYLGIRVTDSVRVTAHVEGVSK